MWQEVIYVTYDVTVITTVVCRMGLIDTQKDKHTVYHYVPDQLTLYFSVHKMQNKRFPYHTG